MAREEESMENFQQRFSTSKHDGARWRQRNNYVGLYECLPFHPFVSFLNRSTALSGEMLANCVHKDTTSSAKIKEQISN